MSELWAWQKLGAAPRRAAPPAAGGGFTNVDPETRRIVPEPNGRTVVKVVYVVLESQYQSSLAAAVKNINAKRPEVGGGARGGWPPGWPPAPSAQAPLLPALCM